MTDAEAQRGLLMVEESPEIVAVLDADGTVVLCSRRARVEGIEQGQALPSRLAGVERTEATYLVDGAQETLVYFGSPGALAAYQELRSGFTAAVSHELRTPLARILVHLESAELPGADVFNLIEQARGQVHQVNDLIDEVLFLSQLESGQEVVGFQRAASLPVLHEVAAELSDRAERAGVTIRVEGDPQIELPLRARMQQVIAENFVENAIRYAGEGATITLSVVRHGAESVLIGSDDGIGIAQNDLPRLFERFYRADRARSSRGTGLGLAIVKHIVVSAGGRVDAAGGEGRGLEIRCGFPSD